MEYSLGDLRPTLEETTTTDEGRRDLRPDRSRTQHDRDAEGNAPLHPLDRDERLLLSYHSRLFPGASQPPYSPPRQSPFVSHNVSARQHVDRDPDDDEARLLPRDHDAGSGSPGSLKTTLTRLVRPMSLVSLQSPPQFQLGAPLPPRRRAATARWLWNPSWNMYLFFAFGLACAIGHHVYYSRLDGKPAADQLQMLRYGMALSFAAKAGLSAAVLVAFHQRIWMTVRTRLLSVAAVDALFSANEDLAAFLSGEMIRNAKVAAGLAVFIWLAPLMVILTGNTLLVEPATTTTQDRCPGVRSLNFTFEDTYDWRTPSSVDGLLEVPLSLWNTTKPPDSAPPGWFDYYTAPHPILEQTATIGAFLQQTVVKKHAQVETCGSGWNCSFEVSFVAPGYKCTELASGVGSKAKHLTQESGQISPPFDTDVLIPVGSHSYYAFATGGDYSSTQMEDVGIGGIPKTPPPYPKSFGAFRTEPVLWIGYAELVDPSKPAPLPTSPDWKTSFVPKIFACENYEASYTVRFNYTDGALLTNTTSLSFLSPVINTTFRPHVDANDGTADNVTAVPASNYVLPTDTAHYRRTAAYHSLSLLVRTIINGTIKIDKTIANPIVNTGAIQTKLIDPENRYFPRPRLQTRMQRFYEDIILSMLSRTQFTPVVWAARPAEQSGTALPTGDEYRYPCTKSRTANVYKYQVRDLWIVYGIAILLSFIGVVAGQLAIGDDPAHVRDAAWSSIVAATRGSALDRVNWDGRPDGPADDPMKMKVGYGVVETLAGSEHEAPTSTGWEGGKPMMAYGFGPEGQVRQR